MENQVNVSDQNNQKIGQNPVSQPVITPEKPKANFLMLGGIVLACFVLFGFGGYYLGKQSSNSRQYPNNEQSQLGPTATPTTTPTSQQASNSVTDWKTYTNQKYNFSIQYPNDFKTNEITSQFDDTFVGITNQQTERERGVDDDKMAISIITGGKDFKRTDFYYGGYEWTKSILESLSNVQNGVNKDHKYDTITKLGDINVAGFTGVKYKAIPKQGTATEGFSTINVALMKGDKTFLISGYTGNDILIFNKPYAEIFDQVVNTFKSQN